MSGLPQHQQQHSGGTKQHASNGTTATLSHPQQQAASHPGPCPPGTSALERAGLWSRISFAWVGPLIDQGWQQLHFQENEARFLMPACDDAAALSAQFEKTYAAVKVGVVCGGDKACCRVVSQQLCFILLSATLSLTWCVHRFSGGPQSIACEQLHNNCTVCAESFSQPGSSRLSHATLPPPLYCLCNPCLCSVCRLSPQTSRPSRTTSTSSTTNSHSLSSSSSSSRAAVINQPSAAGT